MSAFSSQSRGRRAISATEEEIVALLDRLDELDGDSAVAASEEKGERFEYRIDSCEVALRHIGATNEVTFVVPTRNMSTEGMTFLHSGFAHTGSRCTLALMTNNGSCAKVKASVSNCRYLENWLHEVSVDFDAKIHAPSFCPPSPEWTAAVFVTDDDECRQVRHYLTVLRADVKRAANANDIISMMENGASDCILVELDPPGFGGLDAVKEVRSNGYEGVILGILDDSDASREDEATGAGCTRCLAKPYGPELMKAVYEAVRGS